MQIVREVKKVSGKQIIIDLPETFYGKEVEIIVIPYKIIPPVDKKDEWKKDFSDDVADTAAAIFRELKERNQIIEYRDIFIAATARCYEFWVATLNVSHFERIDGLRLRSVN